MKQLELKTFLQPMILIYKGTLTFSFAIQNVFCWLKITKNYMYVQRHVQILAKTHRNVCHWLLQIGPLQALTHEVICFMKTSIALLFPWIQHLILSMSKCSPTTSRFWISSFSERINCSIRLQKGLLQTENITKQYSTEFPRDIW